jgi:pimeloyl-ACP methyl ester carboxylesterase
VITDAAASASNVKALVYVAAFAPEAGEAIGAFGEKYPVTLGSALSPDAAGLLYVDPARFREIFASDLPEAQVRVIAAAQKPIIGTAFRATVTQAAWKTIPSWYAASFGRMAMPPASYVSPEAMAAQARAITRFADSGDGWAARLKEIGAPTFVANGDCDGLFPAIDSIVLAREIPQSRLGIYPDSGHGFLYQYVERFSEDVLRFLGQD